MDRIISASRLDEIMTNPGTLYAIPSKDRILDRFELCNPTRQVWESPWQHEPGLAALTQAAFNPRKTFDCEIC